MASGENEPLHVPQRAQHASTLHHRILHIHARYASQQTAGDNCKNGGSVPDVSRNRNM
jgi:hypothetical protein